MPYYTARLMELDCVPANLFFLPQGRAILEEGQAAIGEAQALYRAPSAS